MSVMLKNTDTQRIKIVGAVIFIVVLTMHSLKLVGGMPMFGFKRTTLQEAVSFFTTLRLFLFELQ